MKYRSNGAVGAILDEYERAIGELKDVISSVSQKELMHLIDPDTNDPDCRSIQSVLSHVVRAGYTYAILIRNKLGENCEFKTPQLLEQVDEYNDALDVMFKYNEQLFLDYPDLNIDSYHHPDTIQSRWQAHYDVEQLYEHAIVHILRHRRQIERFLLKMRDV